MKVYLASSFDLKDKVELVANILKKEGFEIAAVWWKKDSKEIDVHDSEWYNLDIVKRIHERALSAIDTADALILVATDTPRKFNGANIELGYAIGKGKPVLILGNVERSAMYHGCMKFANIEGIVNRLKNMF